MHPALSIVNHPPNTDGAGIQGEDIYAVYADSNGISYVVFPSTLAFAPSTLVTHYEWRGCGSFQGQSPYNTTFCSADNPKVGFWGQAPDPLPVIWQDGRSVNFDKIITSTCVIPTVSSNTISQTLVAGTSDFLNQNTFSLAVTGSGFSCYQGNGYPKYAVLSSSAPQTDISTTSVNYPER